MQHVKSNCEKMYVGIARWMYNVAIHFDVTNNPSFQVILEFVGQFGVSLKGPNFQELWVPLLNKEATDVKNLLQSH